jgi:hypothetical protein
LSSNTRDNLSLTNTNKIIFTYLSTETVYFTNADRNHATRKVFEKREQGRQPPEYSNTHKVMNGTTEGMPDLGSGVTKEDNPGPVSSSGLDSFAISICADCKVHNWPRNF